MLFPLKDDNPTTRTPYVTYGLIAVNVAVMLWLSMMPPQEQQAAVIAHGFVPKRIAQLTNPQLVVQVPLRDQEPVFDRFAPVAHQPDKVLQLEPVRGQVFSSIFTTMFLHGGWFHLLGNIWFLWIFGNNVEDRLGSPLYLAFYVTGGLLATACHWAYDPSSVIPVVGASGAIATILGAYAVTFPKARVRTLFFLGIVTVIDIPALVWLGLWFIGELFSAYFTDDLTVAVWAHIGGFVAGACLMPILSFGAPPGSSWEEELKRHFSLTPSDWK